MHNPLLKLFRDPTFFWKTVPAAFALMLVVGFGLMSPQKAHAAFHGATIQKSCVGPSGLPVAREGETVNCTIRVTNADDFGDHLTITSISDVVHHQSGDVATGNLLGAPVVLNNKGDFVEKSHSYVVEVGDKDPLKDDASTQGNDPAVGDFNLSFPGLVDIIHPSTTLTKTADPTTGRSPLDVTYTYQEKNDGDAPISSVTISDDKCSPVTPTLGGDGIHNVGDTNTNGVLDPGETWVFTCKATLLDTTTNLATASGTVNADQKDAPKEEARATVKIINPHTILTKEASPSSGRAPLNVTYTYKEKNDGNDPISNVTVTDDKCSPVTPTLGIDGIHNVGDTNNNGILDPGETWIFTCKATLNVTTTNTATASGTASDQQPAPNEEAKATVKVFTVETLLTKEASPSTGVAPLAVTYTYKEKNTGTSPIVNVALVDDTCSPLVRQTDNPGNNDNILDPGETWVYTCSQTFNTPGTYTNHVVATGIATFDKKPAPEERAEATVVVKEAPKGCTFTQGYWKNHPAAWPVSSLSLGSVSYSKAQLLNIFKTPVKGNGLISLSHQLIAAKLNIASGASSASIASTIASADALIGGLVVPPIGNGFLSPSSTSSLTSSLDNYNTGLTGPGHCSE